MQILSLVLFLSAAPSTKKLDVVDDYFGTQVADPYRWLEDDNAADTKAWVDAQNRVTQTYLAQVPERDRIRARLTKMWNYERFTNPEKKGGNYFFFKNDGLQNQGVLYVSRGLNDTPRVLIDPNTLTKDGTAALGEVEPNDDGTRLAYSVSDAGSDWQVWRVRDVASGRDLADELRWVKFSGVTWAKDGSGFYYTRYPAPKGGDELKGVNKNNAVYFHKLGAKQTDDTLIYDRKDQPDWGFDTRLSDDGRYLLIVQHEGSDRKNRVFLRDAVGKVSPFLDTNDAAYDFLGNDGDTFYFRTDAGAPRFRIVAVNRAKPSELVTLVAETKNVLESANLVAQQFAVVWSVDAHHQLSLYSLDGKPAGEVALPGIGSASVINGERSDQEGFFTFTSFNAPLTVYRYDFTKRLASVFKQPRVDFKPEAFETKQVFYKSKDGTTVPMFITHKKGLMLDGNNPTYLYGYGGFTISMTPSFSPAFVVWMEMGGVYAVANLRGGGEYGAKWHDAGRLGAKQNVFDDFIAAGEWLVANKYTNSKKLAVAGGSNGGLLVGAVETQRPDLFAACVPAVGVMDMLRFHKFTIGWAWKSDYGSSESKEGFEVLYKYSPLHNIKPGTRYPATLVLTADHDDRVVPAHSHKFTATLQAAQGGDAPILTRIEQRAGHGKGKSTTKLIEEKADVFAFLVRVLGMKPQS